jgi:hypothetical protein
MRAKPAGAKDNAVSNCSLTLPKSSMSSPGWPIFSRMRLKAVALSDTATTYAAAFGSPRNSATRISRPSVPAMHPPLFRKTCRLGCEGIVSKRLGTPHRSKAHRCQARGGNVKSPRCPRALMHRRSDGSGRSGAVVFVPAMRRLVLGHELFAPAGKAKLSFSHQSGHRDLHLSLLTVGRTLTGAIQPRA